MAGTQITGDGHLVSGLGGSAGYGEIELPRNDDGFTAITDISAVFESGLRFFGTTFTSLFVNTNGSISFGDGVSAYTPTSITDGVTPMIAPYWADVDTRAPAGLGAESAPVFVDIDPVRDVITVTWPGVNFFLMNGTLQNAFQLQLYDRGQGDFDIVFRYEDIQWTTGDASSGSGGLGGSAARIGYTAGDGAHYLELVQSGQQGALLALEDTIGNSGVAGRWDFAVRNGEVLIPTSDIFAVEGDLVFLAELARAAYHLRDDNAPLDAFDSNETPSSNPLLFDIFADLHADDSFALADRYLDFLDAADFGTVGAGLALDDSSLIPSYVDGLENGLYTSGNAAALIARSQDALFVAFRGTNDNFDLAQDLLPAGFIAHWAQFSSLRTAIDAYIADPANGIEMVYVTGHSLGGAMAGAMMADHTGDPRFVAATFGSPGYGLGSDAPDARVVNLANDGDTVAWTTLALRIDGDKNTLVDGLGRGLTAHSIGLYVAETELLRDAGVDRVDLASLAGVDYDTIAMQTYADGFDTYDAGRGDEVLTGSEGRDLVVGGAGVDALYGLGGGDWLDGGSGNDFMLGGVGDDVYIVDSTFDLVDEGAVFPAFIGSGFDSDTIRTTAGWFWDVYSVGELLVIEEGAAGSSGAGTTIVGSIFSGALTGNSGTNIMFGRGGADTYRAGDGIDYISLSLLGLTEQNAYVGVDGANTVIVDQRSTGAFSYDIVFDFESGKDRLDVSDYGYGSVTEVLARGRDDGAGNSYYALGDGLDYLYIVGRTTAQLQAADFIL